MDPVPFNKANIRSRLQILEGMQEATKICSEQEGGRLRDAEENIRIISKDIILIKESQIATHKRITENDHQLKENMRIGFEDLSSGQKEMKTVLYKYIESTKQEIENIKTWKDNVIGGLKLLLGIPVILTIITLIVGIIKYISMGKL